ncbi:hypothetical protein ACVWYH_002159 [Bradyrhizobium sp. GM24.11]
MDVDAVQHGRAALRPALGCGPIRCGLAGCVLWRPRSWQLGLGRLTDAVGVDITLLVSAGLMLLLPLLGRWLRMPAITERGMTPTCLPILRCGSR